MNKQEQKILFELQKGLPLDKHPYLRVAEKVGCSETDILRFIKNKQDEKIFSRFGLIVMHRNLGYQHNAMVVWNIPDARVDVIANKMAEIKCINLCYRRPRVLPDWPYNLFCMIHAKSRKYVHDTLTNIKTELDISHYPCAVLFSEKAFKQTGAKYVSN